MVFCSVPLDPLPADFLTVLSCAEYRRSKGSFLHLSAGFRLWVLLGLHGGGSCDSNLFQAKTYTKQFLASCLCSGSLYLHSPVSTECR